MVWELTNHTIIPFFFLPNIVLPKTIIITLIIMIAVTKNVLTEALIIMMTLDLEFPRGSVDTYKIKIDNATTKYIQREGLVYLWEGPGYA